MVKAAAGSKYEYRKSFTLLNSQIIEFHTHSKERGREREGREKERGRGGEKETVFMYSLLSVGDKVMYSCLYCLANTIC